MRVHPLRLLKNINISTGTRNLGENTSKQCQEKSKDKELQRQKRTDVYSQVLQTQQSSFAIILVAIHPDKHMFYLKSHYTIHYLLQNSGKIEHFQRSVLWKGDLYPSQKFYCLPLENQFPNSLCKSPAGIQQYKFVYKYFVILQNSTINLNKTFN